MIVFSTQFKGCLKGTSKVYPKNDDTHTKNKFIKWIHFQAYSTSVVVQVTLCLSFRCVSLCWPHLSKVYICSSSAFRITLAIVFPVAHVLPHVNTDINDEQWKYYLFNNWVFLWVGIKHCRCYFRLYFIFYIFFLLYFIVIVVISLINRTFYAMLVVHSFPYDCIYKKTATF